VVTETAAIMAAATNPRVVVICRPYPAPAHVVTPTPSPWSPSRSTGAGRLPLCIPTYSSHVAATIGTSGSTSDGGGGGGAHMVLLAPSTCCLKVPKLPAMIIP